MDLIFTAEGSRCSFKATLSRGIQGPDLCEAEQMTERQKKKTLLICLLVEAVAGFLRLAPKFKFFDVLAALPKAIGENHWVSEFWDGRYDVLLALLQFSAVFPVLIVYESGRRWALARWFTALYVCTEFSIHLLE